LNKQELDGRTYEVRGIFEEYKLPFIIYQSMALGLIREGKFFNERVPESPFWERTSSRFLRP